MTVQELIDQLECQDPELEVRIAFQPSYPLAAHVANIISSEEIGGGEEPELEDTIEAKPIVWLAATESVGYNENPYAPRGAWN